MTVATNPAQTVFPGYVYIGGYQPTAETLFIKGGKSYNLSLRAKQYGTMLPGGLSFLWAARVDNPHHREKELLAAIAKVETVEAVGGEWFRCNPFLKLTVLDELNRLGPMTQVRTFCPGLFGEPRKRRRRA
jgi:hypothetical protein